MPVLFYFLWIIPKYSTTSIIIIIIIYLGIHKYAWWSFRWREGVSWNTNNQSYMLNMKTVYFIINYFMTLFTTLVFHTQVPELHLKPVRCYWGFLVWTKHRNWKKESPDRNCYIFFRSRNGVWRIYTVGRSLARK